MVCRETECVTECVSEHVNVRASECDAESERVRVIDHSGVERTGMERD
jgi:hypothetical protein